MNKVYVSIYLNEDRLNADGTATVFLRITINRKYKLFSTTVHVLPKYWEKNRVTHKDKQYIFKNHTIDKRVSYAQEIITKYDKEHKPLTLEIFKQEFTSDNTCKVDFYNFVKNELDIRGYCFQTAKTYRTQITKLQRFRPKLTFQDINLDFINGYKAFMENELGNKPNTFYKSLSMLKVFVNWAIAKNLVKENPFNQIKIKKFEGDRVALSIDELNILYDNLLNNNKLTNERKEILSQFLFSCYTGLRYSDLKILRKKNFYYEIIDGEKRDFLKIEMHKTKLKVSVPVIPKAKSLIKDFDNKIENERIFKVRTNQISNRRIKEIIATTEIDKSISFHCARHTFACVGLEFGIPIEAINKMMGHTELKITQIYAKTSQRNKFNQLMKMN